MVSAVADKRVLDHRGQDRDAVWRELVAAGVDHINTDDLKGLADFLR
jgi:hypothetical protein